MNVKRRSYHTLRDFLFVIFKHRTLIVFFFVIIVLTAIISFFIITPMYESCAKLLVMDSAKENIGTPLQTEPGFIAKNAVKQSTLDAAVEMLSGRYLAEKVIKSIGVDVLYPGRGGRPFQGKLPGLKKALLQFQQNLTVTRGNIIEVKFLHKNPSLAAKVVNTLIEEFLDYYLAVQKQDQKYEFFKKQATLIGKRLQESQNELGLFRNEHNISSIKKQKSLLLLQISDLEVELAKIRAEISEHESAAASLKKSSTALTDIQRRMIALKSKEKKLYQHVTQYKLELNRLDKAETRLQELERQVKMDEENYLLYTKKMEEARIASAMDEQKLFNLSIIEPALQPITPVKPQKTFIITIAIIFGSIGGLLLAFVSEYFTHTFDHREDIEEILSCATAASFPELNRQEQNQLKAFKVPEKIIEKCNRLKHYFIRKHPGKNKTIVFCASKENEGSSTVLLSFAITLATGNEKVLVIDANLRNPSLSDLLGTDATNGLSDILAGKASVTAAIKTTPVENLMLITSGTPKPNPFGLLQSERFDPCLQEIKKQADWILLDTPPINVYNDVCVITPKMDGVTLIVKAGKTRWEVATSGVNRLKQCNAKILGAVLNRQKHYIPGWLYNML